MSKIIDLNRVGYLRHDLMVTKTNIQNNVVDLEKILRISKALKSFLKNEIKQNPILSENNTANLKIIELHYTTSVLSLNKDNLNLRKELLINIVNLYEYLLFKYKFNYYFDEIKLYDD